MRNTDRIATEGKAQLIHEMMKPISTERDNEEAFMELFQECRTSLEKAIELVPEIYSYSLNIISPKVVDMFNDNFPFDVFFEIVTQSQDFEIQSLAIQCLGEASDSRVFPVEFFAQPQVLAFVMSVLGAEDTRAIKGAVRLLGNIAGAVPMARECVLSAGIMQRLIELEFCKITSTEFVHKACKLEPPPPMPLLEGIVIFLKMVLDGSEVSVLDLALESICYLLDHEAEGITGDLFYEYLPHMLISRHAALVRSVIKILSYVSEPTPDICMMLVQTLQEEDQPGVLTVLVRLFAKLKSYMIPVCGKQIFELIMSKIGGFPYSVEVACLQVAFEYFDMNYISDMRVFHIVLRFVESVELSADCMRLILMMIERTTDTSITGQMVQLMGNVSSVFEELATSNDDDIVGLAERCLDLIESAGM